MIIIYHVHSLLPLLSFRRPLDRARTVPWDRVFHWGVPLLDWEAISDFSPEAIRPFGVRRSLLQTMDQEGMVKNGRSVNWLVCSTHLKILVNGSNHPKVRVENIKYPKPSGGSHTGGSDTSNGSF